ncbi:MAG TPA: hypothetical protein PKM99_00900 [Thermotogota bacterium]|nr:hypothetical protein [Thermotogaceae bacterium]HNT94657.1 hypothetical protein [Thermotogota bacterium]HOZ11004.1 hypothetical protein [Thermotogota bacterium]HPH09408.1 hypothetical protein [Thermotogota bacterium]HPM19877.1 hypothetical protein [Thermotogota bacterium]
MEISIDKLLNILVSQVESISAAVEDLRLKQNVVGTVLMDSGMVNEEKIKNAVKKQFHVMKSLNPEEKINEEEIDLFTKEIVKWFQCDILSIKEDLERIQHMLKQMAKDSPKQDKGRIQIATPGLLNDLDRLKKTKM